MRKISADYICPVSSPPIKNGIIVLKEDGSIADVLKPENKDRQSEYYQGIIVPGFVNSHCHLELSHLKGQLSERSGFTGFASELLARRSVWSEEQIKLAAESAEAEMIRNGIVAVADISNASHSFSQKRKNKIAYHTFIEIFDLAEDLAEKKITVAKSLLVELKSPRASITPHAPYSTSGKLMQMIDNLKQPFISIHNQESAAENDMFATGTGLLAEFMKKAGVNIDAKKRAGSPLLYSLSGFIETKKILLVHNTFTSEADLELIRNYSIISELQITFCFCPRANLFIEDRIPEIPMFMKNGAKITLGTDSYASNRSLSVLEEMKIIAKTFPEIPFETILTWATKNGAEFLGMENEIGTIEKGKKPGLNLLKGMNEDLVLSEKVSVQKLC